MGGLFITAAYARSLGDLQGFVAFSAGLQVFSIVIFIPGALSSYFVPRLSKASDAAFFATIRSALKTYLILGCISCLGALVIGPVLLAHLGLSLDLRTFLIYGIVQLAAALAALNAAFNQLLVSAGRFSMLTALSALWLLVLLLVQYVLEADAISVSLSLFIAYSVLLLSSWLACRSHRTR
jgi:hypothetical protein